MARHRLVVIGDSLSQGFMSGAIHRTDISYPVWIADAIGWREEHVAPDFSGQGGLPINLEMLLRELSKRYRAHVDWYEFLPMFVRMRERLDDVEDYWERGKGTQPYEHPPVHDLAVWGFEVADAWLVTEGVCRRYIDSHRSKDDYVEQIPDHAMYRTARRVLNPSFANAAQERSQLDAAKLLAQEGGIENLIVWLGANNALGSVTSLDTRESEERDLDVPPHDRRANLYLPSHFRKLYERLAARVEDIGAQNVYVATVPHVTIPPVTRGVSPDGGLVHDTTTGRRYFEYYTRPWIWDDVFDPARHPHLTREQARRVDRYIDEYNAAIRTEAEKRGWHVVDACALLDGLAARSREGGASQEIVPGGLLDALEASDDLRYLVDTGGNTRRLKLDSRFFMAAPAIRGFRVRQGGLFSLDGIHPTTIGYGLIAQLFLEKMADAGVVEAGTQVDWTSLVRADTLVNDPPAMLIGLKDTMAFLDRRALFRDLLRLFARD